MKPRRTLQILRFLIVASLLAGLALASPVRAIQEDISNNLGNDYSFSEAIDDVTAHAQAFMTTDDNVVVTQVELPLWKLGNVEGTYTVEIYTVSGNKPGAVYRTVAANVSANTLPTGSFDGSTAPVLFDNLFLPLAASTSYYLVVRGTALDSPIWWDYTSLPTGIGFPSNYSYRDSGNPNWYEPTQDSFMQMRIAADTVCTSTGSGDWQTSTTWTCGHVPLDDEPVVILDGHTVTLSDDVTRDALLWLDGDIEAGSGTFTWGSAGILQGSGEIIGQAWVDTTAAGQPYTFNNLGTQITFETVPDAVLVTLFDDSHPNANVAGGGSLML
jgi:hypothetical protein